MLPTTRPPRRRKIAALVAAFLALVAVAAVAVAAVVVGSGLILPPQPLPPARALPTPTLAEVTDAASLIAQGENDGNRYALAVPANPKRLVVYAHGNKQTEQVILTDPRQGLVTSALLDAGYIVAASAAGGSSWGNQAGVDAYLSLIASLTAQYPVEEIYLIGESMGGLSAVQVAGRIHARALAAIYPVCDLRTMLHRDDIVQGVAAAWGSTPTTAVSPVAAAGNVPLMVWASDGDTRVPTATNGQACVDAARAAGNEATLIPTTGDHGDPSNFDPAAIVAFFDSH